MPMELYNYLHLGKRIYIIKDKSVYITNIQDIKEGNAIMLAVPISRGLPVFIADGTSIEVGFWELNGIFSYQAVVIQSIWTESLRMYLVKPSSKLTRLQRRNNFRLPVACKVQVQILDEDSDEITEEFSTRSLNVSLGGICIKAPRFLEKGTKLICMIDMEESGSLRAVGRVVQYTKTNAVDETYALGVEFKQCSSAELRRLARFLRMQELRRRRLQ